MTEPILIKAGDERVLLGGRPLFVDTRIVAEDRYQTLLRLLSEAREHLVKGSSAVDAHSWIGEHDFVMSNK